MNKFIHTIDKNQLDTGCSSYFTQLISIDAGTGEDLVKIVKEDPSIIMQKIYGTGMYVFDYFYEYIISKERLPGVWLSHFNLIVSLLWKLENAQQIKNNRYYIINLQKTVTGHSELFRILLANDFEFGDPEVLIYSIIARGELAKVESIADIYVIEDYLSIFDVALKYGRYHIIEFFLSNLKLNIESFGKVIDFENLDLEEDWNDETDQPQDTIKSLELCLLHYTYTVTEKTLRVWLELTDNDAQVLNLLKNHITGNITGDFGALNTIVYGPDWIELQQLREQNMILQDKLYNLQKRYDLLLSLRGKLI